MNFSILTILDDLLPIFIKIHEKLKEQGMDLRFETKF
jgi:hypothetical protein